MRINITNTWDYQKLYRFCKIDIDNVDKLNIVLSLNFISPHDVLLLVQFVIFIKNKKPRLSIILDSDKFRSLQYLREIGLIEFLKENYKQPKTIQFIEKQTAMPIRRVGAAYLEEYVHETLRYIGNICIGKELTVLSVGIKEAINNVYDHSKSEIGAYVFCQFYPAIREIKLCVSDYGCGIPSVVRKKNPDFNAKECVEWALKEKNTTKSRPNNEGMGLSLIRLFAQNTKGSLTILTDNCYYICRGGKERFTNPINGFQGTLIELSIKVDSLEESHDSLDYDWS